MKRLRSVQLLSRFMIIDILFCYLSTARPRSMAPAKSLEVFDIPRVSVTHSMMSATKIAMISASLLIFLPPFGISLHFYYNQFTVLNQ